MLTNEDRERIRSEEMYREEVRQELRNRTARPPTKTRQIIQDIWNILNSQVGGWLLSTVLLGSVAWVYSEWWLPRQEEKAARKSVLAEVQFRLDLADHVPDANKALDLINNKAALNPEHQGRNMAVLLWSLGSLTDNLESLKADVIYFNENPFKAPADFRDQVSKLRKKVETIR